MTVPSFPKVTFGIIVLNGEPFTRYVLRALYPFAHQIIVVEGASEHASAFSTSDGHSTDGTLTTLREFQEKEDPESKLQVITRNGFWKEKDEQSQAFAERAGGNYLWQVDIDEFYLPQDMEAILKMLANDPTISVISFRWKTFWGDFRYMCDGPFLHQGWSANGHHRIFKWAPGYRYTTHRPVTVVDERGRDLRSFHWIKGQTLSDRGIYLYHYSLLFPKQVQEKAQYYSRMNWGGYSEGVARWADENYLQILRKPFLIHNVHTYPSWIERFRGTHPPQIEQMKKDLESGLLRIPQRDNHDVETLLSLRSYRIGRRLLQRLTPIHAWRFFPRRLLFRMASRVAFDPEKKCLRI
jgi:glycosyltransferase involved in cell wall biosynthesis